jgi:hypothetical protein
MKIWEAIDPLSTDYFEIVVTTINVLLDNIMEFFEYQRFIPTLKQTVELGGVIITRVDEYLYLEAWVAALLLATVGQGVADVSDAHQLCTGKFPFAWSSSIFHHRISFNQMGIGENAPPVSTWI